MKQLRLSIFLSILFLLFTFAPSATQAQTKELLGGNVINGTLTGAILGVSAMGLQNTSDLGPLRIGIGAGLLGGVGLALYDTFTLPQGQYFFISGVFNDGQNSSIIILLDTVYGAGGGAVVGTAIAILGNHSLVKGLQYGLGAGAFAGFGFGLIDSFFIAERNRDFMTDHRLLNRNSILELNGGGMELGFIQPGLFSYADISDGTLSLEIEPTINVFSLRKKF